MKKIYRPLIGLSPRQENCEKNGDGDREGQRGTRTERDRECERHTEFERGRKRQGRKTVRNQGVCLKSKA